MDMAAWNDRGPHLCMQAARRELRKDTQFVQQKRDQERRAREAEREAKLKELMSLLSQQQGEGKYLDRERDKARRRGSNRGTGGKGGKK